MIFTQQDITRVGFAVDGPFLTRMRAMPVAAAAAAAVV